MQDSAARPGAEQAGKTFHSGSNKCGVTDKVTGPIVAGGPSMANLPRHIGWYVTRSDQDFRWKTAGLSVG